MPKGKKFVDLCIWIDNNAYKEELTEEEDNQLFEYLYNIIYVLSQKGKFFRHTDDYSNFSLWLTTSVYFRYKNKKQYILDEITNEPKLKKIKSCLNYIKHIIRVRKIEYEQEYYSQVITGEIPKDDIEEKTQYYVPEYAFTTKLQKIADEITNIEFAMCLRDTEKTIKNFLAKLPAGIKTQEGQRIYISCLLTFNNCIVMPYNKSKTNKMFELNSIEEQWEQGSENVILWHLDESYRDYIWIIIQELRHILAKDLSLHLHEYIPSSEYMDQIAQADINLEEDRGLELEF